MDAQVEQIRNSVGPRSIRKRDGSKRFATTWRRARRGCRTGFKRAMKILNWRAFEFSNDISFENVGKFEEAERLADE